MDLLDNDCQAGKNPEGTFGKIAGGYSWWQEKTLLLARMPASKSKSGLNENLGKPPMFKCDLGACNGKYYVEVNFLLYFPDSLLYFCKMLNALTVWDKVLIGWRGNLK
jgi:hypothetical protein